MSLPEQDPTHQQYGADGFGWMCHEDGPIVATHLREVRQGTTVIEVEVTAVDEKEIVSYYTREMTGTAEKWVSNDMCTLVGVATPDNNTVEVISETPPSVSDVGEVWKSPLWGRGRGRGTFRAHTPR